MVDYVEAIKRPFSDFKKLLLGIILTTIFYLLISLFLIFPFGDFTLKLFIFLFLFGGIFITSNIINGFVYECGRLTLKGKKNITDWHRWNYLFIKGIWGTIIEFIYFLPVIILVFISFWKVISTIFKNGLENIDTSLIEKSIFNPEMMFFVLIILLLIFFIGYIMPMVIVKYFENYNFKDAFKFNDILKRTFTKTYFLSFFITILYTGTVSVIGSIIPLFGSRIFGFITSITFYTIFAQVYKEQGL